MIPSQPLDPRKQQILKAVVVDFTRTGVPVGSQALVNSHGLAVSPATIRNELADLVDFGYLLQPHTSAGRIPTDRGYRYFVDFLMEPVTVGPAVEHIVRQHFAGPLPGWEAILEAMAAALALVTESLSLVTAPRLSESRLKHIDLVSLEPKAILVILVLEGNVLKQQVVPVVRTTGQEDLSRLAAKLNQEVRGHTAAELAALRSRVKATQQEQRAIMDHIIETMQRHDTSGGTVILHDGLRNLLKQPEFWDPKRLREVLEIIEEQQYLAGVLEQADLQSGLQILIGSENVASQLRECSMLLTTYRAGERSRGTLAVIGPTRMRYGEIAGRLALVAAVGSEALARSN
jgi:heat-inducible transcriptional repressor